MAKVGFDSHYQLWVVTINRTGEQVLVPTLESACSLVKEVLESCLN